LPPEKDTDTCKSSQYILVYEFVLKNIRLPHLSARRYSKLAQTFQPPQKRLADTLYQAVEGVWFDEMLNLTPHALATYSTLFSGLIPTIGRKSQT